MQRALPHQSCGLQALVWEFGRATSKELTWAVFKPWPVDDCRGSIHESNMFWIEFDIQFIIWEGIPGMGWRFCDANHERFQAGLESLVWKLNATWMKSSKILLHSKSSSFKHSQTISVRFWYFSKGPNYLYKWSPHRVNKTDRTYTQKWERIAFEFL